MTNKKICSCGGELQLMNLLSDPPIPVYICKVCGHQCHQREVDKKEERPLERAVAALLLEDVLDTLVEVGNGTSDEDLRLACKKLFLFRDAYFNKEGAK